MSESTDFKRKRDAEQSNNENIDMDLLKPTKLRKSRFDDSGPSLVPSETNSAEIHAAAARAKAIEMQV